MNRESGTELLRRAAEQLRSDAESTELTWYGYSLVHPSVAAPLASWLESESYLDDMEMDLNAIDVANVILGRP